MSEASEHIDGPGVSGTFCVRARPKIAGTDVRSSRARS
jgi:hypothetical protein